MFLRRLVGGGTRIAERCVVQRRPTMATANHLFNATMAAMRLLARSLRILRKNWELTAIAIVSLSIGMALAATAALPLSASPVVFAQSDASAPTGAQAASGKPLEFDAATIKEHDPHSDGSGISGGSRVYPGGWIVVQGMSLKGLIQIAFGLSDWQISGGEDWVRTDAFDVEATAPRGTEPPFKVGGTRFTFEDERLRQMLQALLIGRFQLKFHTETKSGTIYVLEKSEKPLRLTATKADSPVLRDNPDLCGIGRLGPAADFFWRVFDCTTQEIADFAANYVVQRPVIDKTGLEGHFDFRYEIFQGDASALESGDSSYTSAIDAMGLKMRRTTGPVEVFVIDHAEKPSAN